MDVEGRVTALESSQAILNKIAAEQLLRLRDLEHNVTVLVGVAGSQGQDLKEVQARLERIEGRLDSIDDRLDTIIALLGGNQP